VIEYTISKKPGHMRLEIANKYAPQWVRHYSGYHAWSAAVVGLAAGRLDVGKLQRILAAKLEYAVEQEERYSKAPNAHCPPKCCVTLWGSQVLV
jgi:hypothetical protein